jgi:endoglucanase
LSDSHVPCWLKEQCSYELDVSGGWYDAGDFGKYVVNGGIAAWTLLALHERSRFVGSGKDAFGDGPLEIPESGNGVPDLLDEARYEVEFLLKMQVPEGQPLAGMVHHKIHDAGWSSLGIEPPQQSSVRALHPPSTAATLNLAAVAAQAARIWKSIDPAFSAKCLAAAQRAFAAAQAHPDKFAPERDNQGGGPYADDHVDDEFYWATAELYLTTGDPALLAKLDESPFFKSFPTHFDDDGDGVTTSMTWRSTAALGSISLAVVPSALPDAERARLRDGIAAAGDVYLGAIGKEGYREPLGLGKDRKYPWGSNSFLLNNLVVMSLAYDFTKKNDYAVGVAEGMDYLLGRNPMSQSYVTGYGSVPLQHPHHRFWANSLRSDFPPPPPGAVSGGPNSSLQDPQTRKAGLSRGLPPQKCFVDHIEAWSVNEVAINWNAPLTWAVAFLDEWRGGPR